ncbi:Hypothetical predicted protein [Scomber scombrus]|uniref:Uncharacterized protein n=1 Tax=Scomber scombrus TaxID=13677 RepID=A0AAV1PZI2_SCOSC
MTPCEYVIHTHVAVMALRLRVAGRSKDNRWIDNRSVSFCCLLQLSLPDRSRTESERRDPNSRFFTERRARFEPGDASK